MVQDSVGRVTWDLRLNALPPPPVRFKVAAVVVAVAFVTKVGGFVAPTPDLSYGTGGGWSGGGAVGAFLVPEEEGELSSKGWSVWGNK